MMCRSLSPDVLYSATQFMSRFRLCLVIFGNKREKLFKSEFILLNFLFLKFLENENGTELCPKVIEMIQMSSDELQQ